jgi:hypothetical protein
VNPFDQLLVYRFKPFGRCGVFSPDVGGHLIIRAKDKGIEIQMNFEVAAA